MLLVNVMASTLDGRIGANASESDSQRSELGISSQVDQEFLREEIHRCDAIVVGATSIRANGGCLDAVGVKGYPLWCVLAQDPLASHLAFWQQSHIPRVVISQQQLLSQDPLVPHLVYGTTHPALFTFDYLRSQGYKRVLLFGGGILNSLFYEKNLVDELKLTFSPLILGLNDASYFVAPRLLRPVRLILQSSHSKENFVFLSYKVMKS